MRYWIGCSGFYYKEWKDEFYPHDLPSTKWFSFYSKHFNTLELNVTFYHFPTLKSLQNWYDQSPGEYMFSVKAPRAITHYKKFTDTANMITDFYDTIAEGLREKLGCVLFQLPSSIVYSNVLLEKIIQSLDTRYKNVVEFRHASWWTEEVFTQLQQHHITFSGISHPTLPDEAVLNNSFAYYRFHGVPKLYYSEYNQQALRQVATTISESKQLQEAFIYFNNTANISAIKNAEQMTVFLQEIQV